MVATTLVAMLGLGLCMGLVVAVASIAVGGFRK